MQQRGRRRPVVAVRSAAEGLDTPLTRFAVRSLAPSTLPCVRLPAVLSAVDDVIRDVSATIVMPKFNALTPEDIAEKTPGDLVTIADQQAETALTERLTALLPVPVLGEEATAADPDLINLASKREHLWIIDPIDGTINFAHSREAFAIMVAFVWHGRLAAAWIYQPVPDRMFLARAGKGTQVNGQSVRSGGPTDPDIAELAGTFTFRKKDSVYPEYEARRGEFKHLDGGIGSAGWEYPALAEGTRDFAIFKRSLPWDHAPGALILREAGGVVRRWDGTDYHPADGKTGIIAARNDAIWQAVVATLPSPQ